MSVRGLGLGVEQGATPHFDTKFQAKHGSPAHDAGPQSNARHTAPVDRLATTSPGQPGSSPRYGENPCVDAVIKGIGYADARSGVFKAAQLATSRYVVTAGPARGFGARLKELFKLAPGPLSSTQRQERGDLIAQYGAPQLFSVQVHTNEVEPELLAEKTVEVFWKRERFTVAHAGGGSTSTYRTPVLAGYEQEALTALHRNG